MAHDGASHRNALALTSGQRRGLAGEQLVEAEDAAASFTRSLISGRGIFCSFKPNAMLSNTLMCG